jgi:ABC-2 type transport system ATP-binding protein
MSVPTGQVYGFLGPNGSGKTTALRLLTGLLRPNAGTIWLFGQEYSWKDRKRLFRVGSLIETPAFYPYLSGRDNLRVIAATGAPTERSRIEEVLDYVGLKERARGQVKTYSLGMRQRLGLASALLRRPRLLVLDEPTDGIDPIGRIEVRNLLAEEKARAGRVGAARPEPHTFTRSGWASTSNSPLAAASPSVLK